MSECEIQLQEFLNTFMSEERKSMLQQNLENRTDHIQVLMEDIYQPHNAAAVLRSSDAFGIQNIHILEQRYEFEPSRQVSMGSEKWVDVHRYEDVSKMEVLSDIKNNGFKLVATVPNAENTFTPHDLPLDAPIVLMFGSERPGLTSRLLEQADYHLTIPMFGFAESFNVSVSVALCLQVLTHRIRHENVDWQLPEKEKQRLMLDWSKRSVKNSEALIQHFIAELKLK